VDLVFKFVVCGGEFVFGSSRNKYRLAMSATFGSIWTIVMIRMDREPLGPDITSESTDGAGRMYARTSLPTDGEAATIWCR
jgi:hypothetical protein